MSGGTISGNTSNGSSGGVYVASDTFTMTGGTISGNTGRGSGGGVYVEGTFIKSGTGNAIIYGSNAPDEQVNRARDDSAGHAVCFGNGKKRNTTARVVTAMDSAKNGPSGG
ncbi:hypothetical protein ACYULU_01730 [Breznakiellaceae bacterium SP9]